MRPSLLEIVRCPACGGPLDIQSADLRGQDITEGTLRCQHCSADYSIHKGIPYLFQENSLWSEKAQEARGWVSLWNKKGMYDRPTLEDSFRLPYMGGIWTDVARMFDLARQEMTLTGQETILDLGAGQGWAARYFAAQGCRVVAADIVADEWYGLGRSWAIMEHAGVYFEPILADGENLPVLPGTFDIVFLCGTLHHFKRFDRVLSQIHKALKPGGRVIAAGEPSISMATRERDVQAMLEETQEGIIERRPKVWHYWLALRRAGFQKICIDTFETHHASPLQVYNWIVAVRHNLGQVVRRRYKPLVWLAFSAALALPPRLAGQITLYLNGGNLLLRATKP